MAKLDTRHVLWTDPDVIFYKDINSCTIPSPHIMSVGPESTTDGIGNCGVIYFNLDNYRLVWHRPRSQRNPVHAQSTCNARTSPTAGCCTQSLSSMEMQTRGISTLQTRTPCRAICSWADSHCYPTFSTTSRTGDHLSTARCGARMEKLPSCIHTAPKSTRCSAYTSALNSGNRALPTIKR
jgi:hypothetical protein